MLRNLYLRFLTYILIWTAIASFFSLQAYLAYKSSSGTAHVGALLKFSFSEWYVWALLAPLAIWLARKLPLSRDRIATKLAVHLVAAFALTLAHWWLDNLVLHYVFKRPGSVSLVYLFHSNLITYWVVVGATCGYHYYVRYRRGELRAAQLSAQLAQAQLLALRAQFHPHFIFNTLNAISELVHRDPEEADRMIARLSDLLRVILEGVGVQRVPLVKEIEFLRRYLEIEQARFADRLTVRFQISADALHAYVPYLMMQPIVENAIRHGIARRAGVGVVEICAARDRDKLIVEVRDNGGGLSQDCRPDERKGTGISSTQQRLKKLFGDNFRFELRNGPAGGAVVTTVIPYTTIESDDSSG